MGGFSFPTFGLPSFLVGGLKTYDFKNWAVDIANRPIVGYAEEDGFTIEWTGDWFQPLQGLDGEISRKFVNNLMARVTLSLDQMSDTNGQLTQLLMYDFDGGSRVNTTCFSVSIVSTSPNGGTYRSNDCWIEKPPSITGNKTSGVIQWPLCCPEMPPLIT